MIAARAFAQCRRRRLRTGALRRVVGGGAEGGRRARVCVGRQQAGTRSRGRKRGARVMPFAEWPWDRLKALVLSPGVPLTHPAAA